VPLVAVTLGVDGSAAQLLQIERGTEGVIELRMDGGPLASRAVQTMAQAVRHLAQDHGVAVTDLAAVIAHGGNGRLPALLARQLGLPSDRVWSETPQTGNLGSASLPVAWAARQPSLPRPVAWAAVGAGLTWAAALTGVVQAQRGPRP
jgi:3-oxoacyl-[acyl-carrier-protein] synthase III